MMANVTFHPQSSIIYFRLIIRETFRCRFLSMEWKNRLLAQFEHINHLNRKKHE